MFLEEAPAQPLSPRRLVCVGRICEQKGQLLLLEAAKSLAAQGPDSVVVFAGYGEMRAEAEQCLPHHQLASKVRITGWISNDQVRHELSAARAMVLPSFAEGLPVVIMEAMALRRPVISTFIAGIPELVESNEHGWLVPAGDVEALATAIQSCLSSGTEELGRMGESGRRRVRLRHDADREAKKLDAVLRRRPLHFAK